MPETFTNYYRSFREELWRNAKPWAGDNILFGVIMIVMPPIIASIAHHGRYHVDWELIKLSLWSYGAVLVVYVIVHALRTPWKLAEKQAKALDDVYERLRTTEQTLASERETAASRFPNIEVKVEDVLITPSACRADCFVQVSLHNSAANASTSVRNFQVSLEISGKTYQSTTLMNAADFLLVDYVHDQDDMANLVTSQTSPLTDVRTLITHEFPLERGKHRSGWLAFAVTELPDWKIHKELKGQYVEYYDEKGDAVMVNDEKITLVVSTISTVSVSVEDAFGNWHSSAKIPFKPSPMRGLTKKEETTRG
jgi:hypothetical protein